MFSPNNLKHNTKRILQEQTQKVIQQKTQKIEQEQTQKVIQQKTQKIEQEQTKKINPVNQPILDEKPDIANSESFTPFPAPQIFKDNQDVNHEEKQPKQKPKKQALKNL